MSGPDHDQAAGPELAAFALAYAACGSPVLPLHTPATEGGCSCRRDCGRDVGKHPRTLHGLSDATTDASHVRQWWDMWPAANIGLATGAVSGLFVLDVDEASDGWDTLDTLQATYGHLPETPAVVTGNRGAHLYFRHPGRRIPNSVGSLGLGLDVRGDGGFVVAPPSLHRSGRRYAWDTDWHPDRIPYAEAPAWLLALVMKSTGPNGSAPAGDSETIHQGRRNACLTSLAGTMRRRGLTEGAILAALLVENSARCRPPLDEAEVSKIAGSVARYAPAAPRSRSTWRGLRVREVRRA